MIHGFVTIAVLGAQILLVLAMFCTLVRMICGPRAQDRVLALDALYSNAILLLMTIGIRSGSMHYVEAGLIIALLGFVSNAALAKFLMRGEVIE